MARILAHAHSNWSHDGVFTLEEWVTHARARLIDVVLLSEHEEMGWTPERYAEYAAACRAASTNVVQLIPGIEFSQNGFHVLGYGLKTFPTRPTTAEQLAEAVRAQGSFLCLAHPGKYGWNYPQDVMAAADAVEVWNSKWIYDGRLGPHPRTLRLARGKQMLVGQDIHKVKHFSPLYLETSGQEVIAEIRAGRFHICHGAESYDSIRLKSGRLRQALQSGRTSGIKAALIIHRLLRGKHPFQHRHQVRPTIQ